MDHKADSGLPRTKLVSICVVPITYLNAALIIQLRVHHCQAIVLSDCLLQDKGYPNVEEVSLPSMPSENKPLPQTV